MKELSVACVAPLSCPHKTVNTRFPVLVTLGVYHVKRNSGYCMISPIWQGNPYKGDSKPAPLFVLGSLWLYFSMFRRVNLS